MYEYNKPSGSPCTSHDACQEGLQCGYDRLTEVSGFGLTCGNFYSKKVACNERICHPINLANKSLCHIDGECKSGSFCRYKNEYAEFKTCSK